MYSHMDLQSPYDSSVSIDQWWEGRGSLGERKKGRGIEGINLPHGCLKILAALPEMRLRR